MRYLMAHDTDPSPTYRQRLSHWLRWHLLRREHGHGLIRKMRVEGMWSGELDENSLTPFLPFLRSRGISTPPD